MGVHSSAGMLRTKLTHVKNDSRSSSSCDSAVNPHWAEPPQPNHLNCAYLSVLLIGGLGLDLRILENIFKPYRHICPYLDKLLFVIIQGISIIESHNKSQNVS